MHQNDVKIFGLPIRSYRGIYHDETKRDRWLL